MSRYDAVLFDSDGVLVEPPARETQAAATRAAFREAGVDGVAHEHVDAICDGVTVEELYDVCAAYGLDVEAFWAARERHDERSQFEAFRAGHRDSYDDVTAVADISVPRGIVSNNHHSTIEFVLEFFDLSWLFEVHYGREKTVGSLRLKKPATHYLDRALADLGGGSALYVGDSGSDVLAAGRAGIDSAFVERPHARNVDLPVEPTHRVDDLHGVADLVDIDSTDDYPST